MINRAFWEGLAIDALVSLASALLFVFGGLTGGESIGLIVISVAKTWLTSVASYVISSLRGNVSGSGSAPPS